MRHHSPPATARLHHLDALRAAAMLLGLALHALLAYTGIAWVPQDRVYSDLLGVAFAAIHGFRMPLFFFLSGYFTGLLWQRRGMRALLRQRAARIALPLVIALQTLLLAVALGPLAKFATVLAATTAILLLAYHWVVRDGWVGRMLNGPR